MRRPNSLPACKLANPAIQTQSCGGATESDFLLVCGNAGLRAAIRKNAVTFPSQMVRLRGSGSENDEPEKIAHLYFICGWSVGSLSRRYGLSKKRIEDCLTRWRNRAVAAGFIQEIQPSKAGDDAGGAVSSKSSLQDAPCGASFQGFIAGNQSGTVQAA